MPLYRPWLRLKYVKVPMLMSGTTGDTVAPFVSDQVRQVGNPNVQVIEIDADRSGAEDSGRSAARGG